MAITDKTEFKAKAEEYTAVADAIRILMGQPAFGQQDSVPYEWTKDYTANLDLLKRMLESISDILGNDSSETGISNQLVDKIDDIQERINDIIDPNHTQRDKTVSDVIDDINDLFDRVDDIVDGDPTQPTGQTPAELIENIEENKEILEEVANLPPDPETHNESHPLDDIVEAISEATNSIRETVPDPDAEPGDPDERTIEEVAEDVADLVNQKDELEQLLRDIEEIIHQSAVYTEEEDPITYYYVVVDGEWEAIPEEEIDPSIYTEEATIDFQPEDGDEAGQEYNDHTAYSFTESKGSVKDYFDTKADEIYDLMDEEELEWEDLTDDQKLIIIFDDLLDYIEGLEAEVEEYRSGGFSLIQFGESVEGTRILTEIENLERGLRATMTPAQRLQERLVIYVSKLLFSSKESFLCTGLIDGVRKDAAFMYTDEGNVNFYTSTSPFGSTKLYPGKYLIRVVLSLQEG